MKEPDKLGATDKLLLYLIGSVVAIPGGAIVASVAPVANTGFDAMLLGFGISAVAAGATLIYQAARG